jgi:HEPN domain-containing protein
MGNEYLLWIRRAKCNLYLAGLPLTDDLLYEELCYNAHQAVEKGLKGFLWFFNVEPKKTHNLLLLSNQLLKHVALSDDIIKGLTYLNNYSIEARYPSDILPITKDEYDSAFSFAEKILSWVNIEIERLINVQTEVNQTEDKQKK